MTDSAVDAARTDRPRRAPKVGGQGQWALGETQPLNANERFKQEDDALNVRARIEDVYSKQGFASISGDDLHGRFRWWGLYTQRKPGIDGGKTASLEPHELEDEYFMLRVRVDGGALTTEQTRVIGEVSRDYARGTADITDRQNIQLHWVRVEDVPAIWERLEAVGLLTTEACGDCPRVILGSPVAGISRDELVDPTPAIEEIQRRYIGDPAYSNLPRKFKSAITGMLTNDVVHEINDISFVGVEHPELGPGYDLWVGGGLSTNPRLAVRLGAFVAEDDVPDVWAGVVSVFRDYGYRRMRHKARLKFLLADWGPEKFREVLETEYLKQPLPDGPAPAPTDDRGDHVGVHEQKDGRYFVGAAPVVGRVSGEQLIRLADTAEAHGSSRVRLTPHQKLLVLDVEQERTGPLVAGAARPRAGGRSRRCSAATPWPAPAWSTASSRSSTPRPPRPAPSACSRSGSPTSSTRSTSRCRSTSTAAPTPAPASRSPTSGSRARSSPTTTATRSRASRSTSAARSGSTPASAARSAG